jgi:hypothetical protein
VFALQTGVESGTALWAYLFLTDARALPPAVAAVTTSGYWIALLLGGVVGGPVVMRTGPRPVLRACLAGMGVGGTLLLLPGLAPAAGIALVGLSAAPMFPLLTLNTADRVGAAWTDRAIGLQSAASAAGSANPVGADRAADRFVRLSGVRAEPAGTHGAERRCIRLGSGKVPMGPPSWWSTGTGSVKRGVDIAAVCHGGGCCCNHRREVRRSQHWVR